MFNFSYSLERLKIKRHYKTFREFLLMQMINFIVALENNFKNVLNNRTTNISGIRVFVRHIH